MANTVVDTDPHAGDPNRRDFIHIAAATAAVGAVGSAVWPLVNQMNPSADVLALASIEFDLSKVQQGQQVVVKWQGKPVFVRYRTQKEIDEAVHDDNAPMKDPAADASRHKAGKPQWLILIGVCTHLGCVPNFAAGEYGGW
ncbi:MAG: ubiquinol-cytochrome c reductase iron-sulfur subunit, partial [Caulobacteraceae bacterium]